MPKVDNIDSENGNKTQACFIKIEFPFHFPSKSLNSAGDLDIPLGLHGSCKNDFDYVLLVLGPSKIFLESS